MQIQTNEAQKEMKSHGSFEFPLHISYEVLSRYERNSFLWHWHPEIEMTFIQEGEILYQVNDRTYHLRKGEGLIGNSNTLHTGSMYQDQDCVYISTTFHPRLIYGYENSLINEKYVRPILENPDLSSIHLSPESPWQAKILQKLQDLYALSETSVPDREFHMQLLLMQLWLILCEHIRPSAVSPDTSVSKSTERIRRLLSFIHDHYMEKLTLDDISAEINLCKSECCRFFKKYMRKSLFDYLLYYRIEKSLPLLAQTDLTVTEIAEQTGFSTPSYFTRVFKEQLGCSPSEYRKNNNPEKQC